MSGTSMVVQWLRMSCNAGHAGTIASWGTKIPHSGKQLNLWAVYCHLAYLTSMQSTSWETLGWKKHKLESIAGRNINKFRYADDTTLMAESNEELKSLLMKVKEESEKVCLKLNIHKTKITASGPITSWQIAGETVETVTDFIWGGSKITAHILVIISLIFSSVQLFSHVRLFVTPWIAARQASLYITNSWSSFKLTSIKSVMPSSHLILGHPLLLLPPIAPSIRVFSNESILRIRWPKYCSFSFSISTSNEHPGLFSFRMD